MSFRKQKPWPSVQSTCDHMMNIRRGGQSHAFTRLCITCVLQFFKADTSILQMDCRKTSRPSTSLPHDFTKGGSRTTSWKNSYTLTTQKLAWRTVNFVHRAMTVDTHGMIYLMMSVRTCIKRLLP